jgi:hypothetical protein
MYYLTGPSLNPAVESFRVSMSIGDHRGLKGILVPDGGGERGMEAPGHRRFGASYHASVPL